MTKVSSIRRSGENQLFRGIAIHELRRPFIPFPVSHRDIVSGKRIIAIYGVRGTFNRQRRLRNSYTGRYD